MSLIRSFMQNSYLKVIFIIYAIYLTYAAHKEQIELTDRQRIMLCGAYFIMGSYVFQYFYGNI